MSSVDFEREAELGALPRHGHIPLLLRLWCHGGRATSWPRGGILTLLASPSWHRIPALGTDLHGGSLFVGDAGHSDSRANFYEQKRRGRLNPQSFHPLLPLNHIKIKAMKFPDPLDYDHNLPSAPPPELHWKKRERDTTNQGYLLCNCPWAKGHPQKALGRQGVDGYWKAWQRGLAIAPSRFSPELARRAAGLFTTLSSITNLEKLAVLEFIIIS